MREPLAMLLALVALVFGGVGIGILRMRNPYQPQSTRVFAWLAVVFAVMLFFSSCELMPRHGNHPEWDDPNYDTTPNP
jgi:hypothetical protein